MRRMECTGMESQTMNTRCTLGKKWSFKPKLKPLSNKKCSLKVSDHLQLTNDVRLSLAGAQSQAAAASMQMPAASSNLGGPIQGLNTNLFEGIQVPTQQNTM